MTATTPAPAPIGAFDRNSAKDLQEKLKKHLADFLEAEGLTISFKGGTYDRMRVTFRTEFGIVKHNAAGEVMDTYALQFESYGESLGFKKSDLGREIRFDGQLVKIVGLEVSAKKFPVVIEYIGAEKRSRVGLKPVLDYIREEDEAKRLNEEIRRRKGALGSPNGEDDGVTIATLGDW